MAYLGNVLRKVMKNITLVLTYFLFISRYNKLYLKINKLIITIQFYMKLVNLCYAE